MRDCADVVAALARAIFRVAGGRFVCDEPLGGAAPLAFGQFPRGIFDRKKERGA